MVANWPEYGGLSWGTRGKDRHAYEDFDLDDITFNPEKAVFPLDLLGLVATVRHERSSRPLDRGLNAQDYFYALSGITYCAHCDRLAEKHHNLKLRSRLSGKGAKRTSGDIPRYRHKPGVTCGCQQRSVPAEIYEADFGRLIQLLTVKPEAVEVIQNRAVQVDSQSFRKDYDIEKKKEEAIALCRKRIDAAMYLYKDGEIDREEYLQIRDTNQREIAQWQRRTTDTERLGMELAMSVEAVDKLARLWDMVDAEDRRGLAQSLFEEVVFDLDLQQIVGFRLKPWAEKFLGLRASLYQDEEGQKTENPPLQGVGTNMPPRETAPYPSLYAMHFEIGRSTRVRLPQAETPSQIARDRRIRELRAQGLSYPQIAAELRIAVGTAWNIVNGVDRS